jgi:hypothetical protein
MSVQQVLAVAERLGADLSVVVVGREVDRVIAAYCDAGILRRFSLAEVPVG